MWKYFWLKHLHSNQCADCFWLLLVHVEFHGMSKDFSVFWLSHEMNKKHNHNHYPAFLFIVLSNKTLEIRIMALKYPLQSDYIYMLFASNQVRNFR